IWSIVAWASSVGVLVMVWTLIGASPPTGTEPIMIWRDWRRSISRHGRMDITAHIGARACPAKAGRNLLRSPYPSVLTSVAGLMGGGAMTKLARLPAHDGAPDAAAADVAQRVRAHVL